MAIQGYLGSVTAATEDVASASIWSLDMTADTTDVTTFADAGWKSSCGGLKSWSGSITCTFTGGSDTGEAALITSFTAGSTVALVLETGSVGSGAVEKFSGNAVVVGFPITNDVNGCIVVTFTFEGQGALTMAAIT